MLTLNLLLALAWMLINNAFGLADLIVGLILGFLVIRVSWRALSREPFSLRRYFRFSTRRPLQTTWLWIRFIGLPGDRPKPSVLSDNAPSIAACGSPVPLRVTSRP